MQAMPDRVRLTGMRFSATHGVYDFERAQPQTFVVDVTCELLSRPDSDELATTLEALVSLRWQLGEADASREAARELKALTGSH